MAADFKDHFSTGSAGYQQYRPGYPAELYQYLAEQSEVRDTAWDCATGSGQAALALADHFKAVFATDASQNQIANATQHPRVRYYVAAAEQSGLEAESIDLVTIAQALHWFDIDKFTTELQRVLKPHGIVSAWSYELFSIETGIDDVVDHLYRNLLDSYWPAERKIVENGYQEITLPFEELKSPTFEMQAIWSLPQVVGYLKTWSAVRRYEQANNRNPVDMVSQQLSAAWGDPTRERKVAWPLTIRIWRK